ncbi:Hypothetical predicted protein, partial [Olea europaea subsp. europaea]
PTTHRHPSNDPSSFTTVDSIAQSIEHQKRERQNNCSEILELSTVEICYEYIKLK